MILTADSENLVMHCFEKKKIGWHLANSASPMVYRHISKDLKDHALWLILHDYAPEDICKLFDISQRSVARWKHNNRVYGSVIPPPNLIQGHPCLLNGNMMHNLYTLLQEAPEMYLSKIQDWIALSHEVHISKTALHENICDAGLSFKLLCRIAGEHDEDFWVEWKQDINAHFTASQMIFVDKTSKDD